MRMLITEGNRLVEFLSTSTIHSRDFTNNTITAQQTIMSTPVIDVLAVVVTCILGIITYYKWRFQYWERRNVPYIKPSVPFGTVGNMVRPTLSMGEVSRNLYEESKKKGYKYVGIYVLTDPVYVPIDPDHIRDIMTKNFSHFPDRGIYYNEKDDPLSAHLVALDGPKWKNLRIKLTPAFSSGKMKRMFHILMECGKQLTEEITNNCNTSTAVDAKDVVGNFTIDIIGSCAFGIDCNSFKDPNADFHKYGRRATEPTTYEKLKIILTDGHPYLAKKLHAVRTPKDVTAFFMNLTRAIVKQRERNNVIRNDLFQILLDFKNNAAGNADCHQQLLTIEELTAQCYLFFVGGYETSSTTMTFGLYELAQNPFIQEKARDEIKSVLDKYNGELTYESLNEMKYMQQIIDEVLRKYPAFPFTPRRCARDYKIPNNNVTIEKGIRVFIPLYGLHHDPEYFSDPETFDPERFSEENKKHIKAFTYLPFGEGPRQCIGLRFALMQVRVGLALLLKDFRFSVNKKTKLPLKLNPFRFVLSVLDDVWLDVEEV